MRFRQKHHKVSVLLLIGLVLTLALGCVSVEAAPNWELSDYRMIKDGDVEYFVGGDTLYRRVNGKDKVLTKWNLTGKDYLSIISGYKNNINISVVHMSDGPTSEDLYTVNYKTGKKVKAITSFLSQEAYGPYIYGYSGNSDNYYLRPIYIWKASGNKMKRIGKLCDFLSGFPRVINKKVYFGTYQKAGDRSVLDVYRSNLNGKGRKKLFTLKSKSGEVFMEEIDKNKITVYENVNNNKIEYEYNMKTGKLSKVS